MRRTVLRETRSSRAMALIFLPFTWNSRRTRPIVSTVSIPAHPRPQRAHERGHSGPSGVGSELHADHPENGVHPREWTGSGRGFDHLPGVLLLERHGAAVSEGGV